MTVAVHSIPLPAFPDAEQAGHLTELKRCAVSLPQFLIGPENRLAKVAVENQLLPGSSQLAFNPLVICGPAGCGKSRLASGLAAVWQQRYPRADILFLSSDQKIANDDRLDQHTTLMVIEDLDLCSGKPRRSGTWRFRSIVCCGRAGDCWSPARWHHQHSSICPADLPADLPPG